MAQTFETPDGTGQLVVTEVRHGCTYAHIRGNNFEGWYPLYTISAFEDHTEQLLADLPESGAQLPWNPSPRFRDFDTTTIEPIHKLPENLEETNSTKGIHNYPDIMEPFPGDPHHFNTPYHSALQSLSDVVDPEEHNDSIAPIEPVRDSNEHDYAGDPYDERIFDDHFIGESSDPTTPEWGAPATMTWEGQGEHVIGEFRQPRVGLRHFADDDPSANRAWSEDDHTPYDGKETSTQEFEDPKDFDFSLDHKADFSEVENQHWDVLPGEEVLNELFTRSPDRFERKHTPQGSDDAEVNPKEASSFDFLSPKESNKYIKHDGDSWVVVQKGTGKPLSHHDSEEEAEASFRAMEMNKHGEVKETTEGFYITLPGGQKEGPFPTRPAAEQAEEDAVNAREAEEREKKEEKEREKAEAEGKLGGVHQEDEGFFATGPGGQKKGPFPTEPAAQEAEQSMDGKVAGETVFNPYGFGHDPGGHPGVQTYNPYPPAHEDDYETKWQYDPEPFGYGYDSPEHSNIGQEAHWPKTDQDNIHWPKTDQDAWPKHDPDRHAALNVDEKTPETWRHYMSFLNKDAEARKAAWADVRKKAVRLRSEGAVDVLSFNPFQIVARVTGDTGTYNTEVNRKNAWGQGITWYDCTCPWGQWTYKRERSYIGRLCSHALAAYYEMQSLHSNKNRRPLEGSVPLGFKVGDAVRVTEARELSPVVGNAAVLAIPGDLGTITALHRDYAEVHFNHFSNTDPSVKTDFDIIERSSLVSMAEVETNDDSSVNPTDAGAFTVDVPDVIQGYESEAQQALDNPTTASFDFYSNEQPPEQRIEIYSEDPDGPREDEKLHTLADLRHGDVTSDDEQDNPSLDEQTPPTDSTTGPTDQGQITASLGWLVEGDGPLTTTGSFEGFDPATVAKITKQSAKNYSLSEQHALIEEAGMAEEVDLLNLKDSFYEIS